jgi:type I restriction enzyme S subunit
LTEWREVCLGDYAKVLGGYAFKSTDFLPYGDYPVIKIKNIAKGYLDMSECQYISSSIAAQASRFKAEYGDILIAMTGSHITQPSSMVGRVAKYNIHVESYINQRVGKVISIDKSLLDTNFLYYFMTCEDTTYSLANIASGSANQANISSEQIESLELLLPDIDEQKAIAEVLSSLDDKINLLTRQNKTLEDLAQVYFRKWFIEDASKEWEVVPISEKFDVLLGGTPSRKIESYWTNGTIGWINSGKINEFRIIEASEYITEEALNNSSAKLLPAGTTVLAITGATLGKISMVLRSFAANQSVIGLVPKAELSNNFIFLWLKENINALISMQTGGAQQHINSNDVKSFDVIVPDTVALSLFRRKIDPLMLKISQNCFQINTLNKLRDTLLPKLISGEIRLKM